MSGRRWSLVRGRRLASFHDSPRDVTVDNAVACGRPSAKRRGAEGCRRRAWQWACPKGCRAMGHLGYPFRKVAISMKRVVGWMSCVVMVGVGVLLHAQQSSFKQEDSPFGKMLVIEGKDT